MTTQQREDTKADQIPDLEKIHQLEAEQIKIMDLLNDAAEAQSLPIDPEYIPKGWENLHSVYTAEIPAEYKPRKEPVFITGSAGDTLILEDLGYSAAEYRADLLNRFIDDLELIPPKGALIICLRKRQARAADQLCKMLQDRRIEHYRIDLYGKYESAADMYSADPERLTKAAADVYQDPRKAEYMQGSALGSVEDLLQRIRSTAEHPAISTGFNRVNAMIGGGLRAQLITLIALSNVGKSALCLQIADQIAEYSREDVLYISLEMSKYEHMSRSISRLTYIDSMKHQSTRGTAKTQIGVIDGSLYKRYTAEERETIRRATEHYTSFAGRIFFLEGANITVNQIRAAADLHRKITGRAPVIIIDYLQILAPLNPAGDLRSNTDRNITELKDISNQFNTPVLLISSINRSSYSGSLNMGSAKESGGIEYGSDIILGLQFKDQSKSTDLDEEKQRNPRMMELKLLKSRNAAGAGKVILRYYPAYNYFVEEQPKI